MVKESKEQKKTVERVMHEYKHGELERGQGGKVTNRRQAVAIALHEAGASKNETPKKNKENLSKTQSKERRGETGRARAEGRSRASSGRSGSGGSKAELYEEARRRNISGRSKMSKEQLERAVGR